MVNNAGGDPRPHRGPRWHAGPATASTSPSSRAASPGCSGRAAAASRTLMRSLVGVQQVAGGSVDGARRRRPGSAAAARPDRLRHPGAERVRRPHRRARTSRFFARVLGADAARDVDRAIDDGRPRRPRRPGRRPALRRPALAGQRSPSRCSATPDLLVLDEPTVGLDPVLRRDLWALFHRLADDGAARARLQPRDGRGRPLRPAAADARGPDPRRRHPRPACSRATGTDDVESAFLALVDGGRGRERAHERPGSLLAVAAPRARPSCAATAARSRCCSCCPAC